MTLETSTEICILPRLAKGSLVRAIVVERGGAAIGGEVVGAQPVLAQHDAGSAGNPRTSSIKRARWIGDLRIGRLIAAVGGRHGLRLTEAIDLHHPGRNRAAH